MSHSKMDKMDKKDIKRKPLIYRLCFHITAEILSCCMCSCVFITKVEILLCILQGTS